MSVNASSLSLSLAGDNEVGVYSEVDSPDCPVIGDKNTHILCTCTG